MDAQDVQWYDDVATQSPIVVQHASSASSVAQPEPSANKVISGGAKRSRKLVRFDSEQAISLFLHHHNADTPSGDDA